MAPYLEIEVDSTKKLSPDEELVDIYKIDSSSEYNLFFNTYLQNNVPVIIKKAADKWESLKSWAPHNKINFDFMKGKYGPAEVLVYDCKTPYFNSQVATTSTFSDYVAAWEKAKTDLLYLKDWHLQNQYEEDKFYDVPKFFASDWLNEYLTDTLEDDYRFVYVGPAGSWTPFHADVFMSYSWSTNICGRKKWAIFPPGEELKLKDSLGNLPYDITDDVALAACRYYEVIQCRSDAIFIPSGWYHQVWNLTDTISINHNWVNGCNIQAMWNSLTSALKDVRKEIHDCRDMHDFEGHCQVMLKASFGMDFKGFYKFLHHIAAKRIDFICDNVPVLLFGCYTLGLRHAIFDVSRIIEVLKLFQAHPACATDPSCQFSLEELIKTVQECIDIFSANK